MAGCGALLGHTACVRVEQKTSVTPIASSKSETELMAEQLESLDLKPLPKLATFGGGCFWCTEAVFQQLDGVEKVVSGYSGGHVEDPTYEEVCDGDTGHAEVIQITYDPAKISFAELLEVHWKTHDPTTVNRQGNDYGPQYRSAVFYHDDEQRKEAEHYKEKLAESGAFSAPVVTEITAFTNFYPAEKYHQNYFMDNPNQGYCAAIIRPKVEKFREAFAEKLKPEFAE
jgi:peptide-methionine (S)-S-oxide reductase